VEVQASLVLLEVLLVGLLIQLLPSVPISFVGLGATLA